MELLCLGKEIWQEKGTWSHEEQAVLCCRKGAKVLQAMERYSSPHGGLGDAQRYTVQAKTDQIP